MDLAAAQALFTPEGTYLDTATIGLPPSHAIEALRISLDEWSHGRAHAPAFDEQIGRSRVAFARLMGTNAERVAICSQVSTVSGLIAASLSEGDEVLLAEGDFTSVLFPFLAAQRHGIKVRLVPLDRLIEEIRPSTKWVAVSAVQSSNGRIIDLDALALTAAQHGTRTYVDITHAAGWLPVDVDRFDVTACGAYKWLCCERGAAFMTVRPEAGETLVPWNAGWYAGEDRWTSIYGSPLRLATSARQFDVSPAWHAWVGAAPTLELLADVGTKAIYAHNTALASAFCEAIGDPFEGSALLSVNTKPDISSLHKAGVRAAERAGAVRLSFHLYNTPEDVTVAASAIRGLRLEPRVARSL